MLFFDNYYGLSIYGDISIDNSIISDCYYGLLIDNLFFNGDVEVNNISFQNVQNDNVRFRLNNNVSTTNLVDCVINLQLYSIWILASGSTGSAAVNNITTCKFILAEGNNTIVTIYDNNGKIVYDDIVGDSLELENTLIYESLKIEHENGIITSEAFNSFGPFTLVAEKTGYQTLTIPNITVTPGDPTIIRGAMVKKEPIAEDFDLSIGVEFGSDIQIGVDLRPIEIGVEI